MIRRLAQRVHRVVSSRSAHHIASATTDVRLQVPALLTTPELVRLGTPQTPCLDHVHHRLMPAVSTPNVDVEEKDGKLFVSGDLLVTQRSGVDALVPQIAGISTSYGNVSPFALASALARPEKAALWSLKAGVHIPDGLVVRLDPADSTHVLWAPRERMELCKYQAALASVGRDAGGAPRDWTCWTDPLALLESLPMPNPEKKELQAKAEMQLRTWRQRPSTRAAFVARALLGLCFASSVDGVSADTNFLAGIAELATVISEAPDYYLAFAAACRRVNEHAVEAGLLGRPRVSAAPALPKGLGGRHFSTINTPRPSTVLLLAHFMGGVPGPKANDLQFVQEALVAARDGLFESAGVLRDLEGEDYDAALEELEFQFTLGRAAARELGFKNMWF
jgi:hypothetical protein